MNEYKIIGFSKPNKVKLFNKLKRGPIELSRQLARRLIERGEIKIENPDSLYHRI